MGASDCYVIKKIQPIWEIPDKNALSAQLETEQEDIKNGNVGIVGICTTIVNVYFRHSSWLYWHVVVETRKLLPLNHRNHRL